MNNYQCLLLQQEQLNTLLISQFQWDKKVVQIEDYNEVKDKWEEIKYE